MFFYISRFSSYGIDKLQFCRTCHQMSAQFPISPNGCFCTIWGKHNQRNMAKSHGYLPANVVVIIPYCTFHECLTSEVSFEWRKH